MTRKRINLLGRLHEARKRLRDAAAAQAQRAGWAEKQAQDKQVLAQNDLNHLLNQGPFGPASALILFDEERQQAKENIAAAESDVLVASKHAKQKRVELMQKERERRVTEKLLDRAQSELLLMQKKQEQKLLDDRNQDKAGDA